MDEEEIEITPAELDELKFEVLKAKQMEISEQLGDPGRYFASFKAKDFISHTDTEEIKTEKNSIERTNLMIEKILGPTGKKRGRMNEHPYDVFVAALRRMRVHIHIVKILNNELASKRAELYSTKRTKRAMKEFQNGFPSNGTIVGGVTASSGPPITPDDDSSLVSKGPVSNTSSPSSSSISSNGQPSQHTLSSPQTDTDGSMLSSPLIAPSTSYTGASSNVLPILPTGFNESGQRINDRSCVSSDGGVTLDTTDLLPVLPPGFNMEGKKINDISEYISPKEPVHPSHGLMPATSPQTESTNPQTHTTTAQDDDTITELNLMIQSLRAELTAAQDRFQECEADCILLKRRNDDLRTENIKLKNANNRLESYVRIITGKDTPDQPPQVTTPHPKTGGWSAPHNLSSSLNSGKRNTEPLLHTDMFGPHMMNHRQSEPNMLNVPTRPNKLPLNKKMGNVRISNSQPNSYSYEHSPVYQRSPNIDYYYTPRGVPKKHSASRDDLTSGGEDGNSMKSFDSGSSNGNVMLNTQQISATETIV